MKAASKSFLSLLPQKLLSGTKPSQPIKNFPILRPLSTKTTTSTTTKTDQVPPPPKKDSLILEKFRQRKQQGFSKSTTTDQDQVPTMPKKDSPILEKFKQRKLEGSCKSTTLQATPSSIGVEAERLKNDDQRSGPTQVVSSFEGLGLKEEVIEAAGEMGVWVPSEIQCVGIPAVLEGKSVVLSSDSGSGRTLAYLLPLLQLLRRDEALSSMKPNHPRAIVLCTTEELSDEGFRMAKFISNSTRLKSARAGGSGQLHTEDVLHPPIGMLLGTPAEVLQQMEEGRVLIDDVKYLVLDEADTMLDHEFGPEISKIVQPLKSRKLESNDQGCQTVLVTSTITKILGNKFSPIMERLEHDNAGKVTAMLLEMDQTEVFDIVESPAALKKKVAEAIDSLAPGS